MWAFTPDKWFQKDISVVYNKGKKVNILIRLSATESNSPKVASVGISATVKPH